MVVIVVLVRAVIMTVIVPVAFGPVRMTVRELFASRVADIDDFDVEHQRLAR
jgi:hypothetical protein